ncbi:MAG: hypothetical protein ACRC2K_06865 [Clostridium sp.]
MKNLKIVLAWMVLAIGLQSLVLFILDRTYFATNSDVDVQKVEIEEDTSENDAHIPIPKDADNIEFSYNGQYVAYFQSDEMKIFDTTNGNEKIIKTKNSIKYSSFKWLSDRNRILLIGRDMSSKTNKMISYDVDADMLKEVDLSNISTNLVIDDITPSTKTGIIYVKATSKDGISSVYRIDNNDKVEKVGLKTNKINDISILPTQDRLVYETNKNNFYITEPSEQIVVKDPGKYTLLGIDDENTMYICKMNNDDKVVEVLSKSVNSSEDIKNAQWKSIKLNTPVVRKNLYLDKYNARVIVNDSNSKKVININNSKEYSYQGEISGIYNNGFVAIENGKLNKYKFKK